MTRLFVFIYDYRFSTVLFQGVGIPINGVVIEVTIISSKVSHGTINLINLCRIRNEQKWCAKRLSLESVGVNVKVMTQQITIEKKFLLNRLIT